MTNDRKVEQFVEPRKAYKDVKSTYRTKQYCFICLIDCKSLIDELGLIFTLIVKSL